MPALRAMSPKELQALWKCNEAIAFSAARSTENNYVFIREKEDGCGR